MDSRLAWVAQILAWSQHELSWVEKTHSKLNLNITNNYTSYPRIWLDSNWVGLGQERFIIQELNNANAISLSYYLKNIVYNSIYEILEEGNKGNIKTNPSVMQLIVLNIKCNNGF